MTTPDIYHIPPTQPNINNPSEVKPDTCYLPTTPMQSVPPPPYSAVAPPPLPSYPVLPPPPPLPSYAALSPGPPLYSPLPVFVDQRQMPYRGILILNNFIPPQTADIPDYMVWSIVNIFLGGFVLGLLAVLLSMQTRKRKREGDVQRARSMSKITLCCNILNTVVFFALTAFSIIYITYFMSYLDNPI